MTDMLSRPSVSTMLIGGEIISYSEPQPMQGSVDPMVQDAFAESAKYFPTTLQQFQFFDKYSRFDYTLMRRETWLEAVDRVINFFYDKAGDRLEAADYAKMRRFILQQKVMPSMRLLATAGKAANKNNISCYNCSFGPVDSIDAFVEALIISMAGCGVGYTVEREYVEQLPVVKPQKGKHRKDYTVEDSAEGWADALRTGLYHWFNGEDVVFDTSQIRPQGAILKTKGGRASGPQPLINMLEFAKARILAKQGSRLSTLEAHDIMCIIGTGAVSGGHRRCLPEGTRVHTKRGAIPIERVQVGDDVMTAVGYRKVLGWVNQGVQKLVEIETETGMTLRCTSNHRVAVLTGVNGDYIFKQAGELSVDDRLLFITHSIDGVSSELLPLPEKPEMNHIQSNVKQPVLDTETAWFLGNFFANGHVKVNPQETGGNCIASVANNSKNTAIIQRLQDWFKSVNITPTLVQNKGENCIRVETRNRQFARWLNNYKQSKTPLVIPENIWTGGVAIRSAFIAGVMDGDGSFGGRPTTVVSTVYKSFAQDLVKLLATLGIIAEIKLSRPARENWQALYHVTIKDFLALQKAATLIGEYSCGTFVKREAKQYGYTVPAEIARKDLPQKEWRKVWAGKGDFNSSTATLLAEATHYVPVKVRQVAFTGVQAMTYDIQVAEQEVFVAEGYLVHNSALISLFDADDEEMLYAKSGDFETDNSQRWNANNSAVWPTKYQDDFYKEIQDEYGFVDFNKVSLEQLNERTGVTKEQIKRQFDAMVASGRGEPGIFNRQTAVDILPARRSRTMVMPDGSTQYVKFGTNPLNYRAA